MEPRLSLVCPVYDEAENIERTLDALAASIRTPFELLVVYDKDDDTTLPVVRRIQDRHSFPIRLVKNAFGRGVPQAIRTGFAEARADAVLVVMADLADDLSIVDRMYAVFEQGFDVVCGSRYMKGGAQIGGPRLKGLLSRTAGVSLHVLLGVPTHDVTNSFKMYRRSFLESVKIESTNGFEIGLELLAKAWVLGRRIAEIPSVWRDRTAGQSRFRMWKWMPHYLKWYLYAFRRTSPAR